MAAKNSTLILLLIFLSTTAKGSVQVNLRKSGEANILTDVNSGESLVFEPSDFPIIFTCISSQATRWTFERSGIDKEELGLGGTVIQRTLENLQNVSYFKSELRISTFEKSQSGKFVCRPISSENDDNDILEFNVFLADKGERPYYLNHGQTLEVQTASYENPVIIPCPVSVPNNGFFLQNLGGWRPRTQKARFEPSIGFLIDTIETPTYEGSYRCAHEDGDEENFVNVNVRRPVDFYMKPKSGLIHVLPDETLEVKCSAIGEIKLQLDNKVLRNVQVTYITEAKSFFHHTAILEVKDLKPGEDGSISCLRSNNGRVIHQWNYKVYDEYVTIAISPDRGHLICKSNNEAANPKPLRLSANFCESSVECDTNFWTEDSTNIISPCGPACQQMTIAKYGGYAISCFGDCAEFNKRTRTVFMGLDNKIYDTLEEIPNEPLLEIEDSTTDGNIRQNLRATCRWIPFHLSNSVQWTLSLANGTVINRGEGVVTSREDGSWSSTFEENLAYEVSSIQCRIFQWNSGTWKQISKVLDFNSRSVVTDQDPDSYCHQTNQPYKAVPLTITAIWHRMWETSDGTALALTVLCFSLVGMIVVGQWIYQLIDDSLILLIFRLTGDITEDEANVPGVQEVDMEVPDPQLNGPASYHQAERAQLKQNENLTFDNSKDTSAVNNRGNPNLHKSTAKGGNKGGGKSSSNKPIVANDLMDEEENAKSLYSDSE